MNRRQLVAAAAVAPFAFRHVAPVVAMDPIFAHAGKPFCYDCDPFGIVHLPKRSPWHISRAFDEPICPYVSVFLDDAKLLDVYAVELGAPSWMLTGVTETGELGRGFTDDCGAHAIGVRAALIVEPQLSLGIDPEYWQRFDDLARWTGHEWNRKGLRS